MQTIKSIGDELDERTAKAYLANLLRHGDVDEKTASLILSGISDSSLTCEQPARDKIRANILKNMLVCVQQNGGNKNV
jgi:transcriptional regulator CtsR